MKTFKSKAKLTLFILPLLAVLLIAGINGCKDAVLTNTENLEMSYQSSTDSTGNDTNDILVLDTVKILVKDIKLNNSGSEPNFKTGPFVLNLNMAPILYSIGLQYIPPGTYDKVKFEVHKLANNEPVPDPDFEDGNGRYSVVVKGWFNGTHFVFKSDKSAHQMLSFPNNLVVSATAMQNITLYVTPYVWFLSNGFYVNPGDPLNQTTIENNIKDNINNNFKIFVDNDKNGEPD